MKKNRKPETAIYSLTLITAKGKRSKRFVPPTELPSDLVPGEFVMIPDLQGAARWFVFSDKQRWWGNGRWNLGGSIYQFDPNTMTETEMYELRRSQLRVCGWIA